MDATLTRRTSLLNLNASHGAIEGQDLKSFLVEYDYRVCVETSQSVLVSENGKTVRIIKCESNTQNTIPGCEGLCSAWKLNGRVCETMGSLISAIRRATR